MTGSGEHLDAERKREPMHGNTARAGVGCAVLAFGAMAIAIVGSIPTANADTASYLRKLHDAGIGTPRGEYELKEMGWEVCLLFLRGKSPVDVVRQAVYYNASIPPYGMTEEQANTIVDVAVSDLCSGRQ